jgi:hypothetical protein
VSSPDPANPWAFKKDRSDVGRKKPAMRSIIVFIGVFVVIILLVSSGIVGGAICLKGVGCLHSSDNGAAIDSRKTVTITTPGGP